MWALFSTGVEGCLAHPASASMQEVLILPLLPMALVAPDEVEKNNSPLYRYGLSPAAAREEGGLPGKGLYSGRVLAGTAVRVRSWPVGRISG